MLSCKEFVKITSTEIPTSLRGQMAVRFHLFICRHCRKYLAQIKILKLSFKKLFLSKAQIANEERIRLVEERVIKNINSRPQ